MKNNGGRGGHYRLTEGHLLDYHELPPDATLYKDFRSIPADKLWIPNLAGWVPVYTKFYGSLCQVLLLDGKEFYSGTSSRWILDKFLTFYDINYSSMRQKYFTCTGRYQSIALPIYQRNTFLFAVKGRHTTGQGSGHNDGAFGYLVDSSVEEVRPLEPRHVRVHLAASHQVDLHMTFGTFTKQRKDAHHFHLCLQHRDRV